VKSILFTFSLNCGTFSISCKMGDFFICLFRKFCASALLNGSSSHEIWEYPYCFEDLSVVIRCSWLSLSKLSLFQILRDNLENSMKVSSSTAFNRYWFLIWLSIFYFLKWRSVIPLFSKIIQKRKPTKEQSSTLRTDLFSFSVPRTQRLTPGEKHTRWISDKTIWVVFEE
jgi:hypothetical protein